VIFFRELEIKSRADERKMKKFQGGIGGMKGFAKK